MPLQYSILATTVSSTSEILPALIFLFATLVILIYCCIAFTLKPLQELPVIIRRYKHVLLSVLYCVTLIALVCAILCTSKFTSIKKALDGTDETTGTTESTTTTPTDDTTTPTSSNSGNNSSGGNNSGNNSSGGNNSGTNPGTNTGNNAGNNTGDNAGGNTGGNTGNNTGDNTGDNPGNNTDTNTPTFTFTPTAIESTKPSNWGITWEIIQNGVIVDSYTASESINFGEGSEYTNVEGITTFRGNNYRTDPSYGTATVTKKTLTKLWNIDIGSFNTWNGSGWTGQPLIVRWPEETKQIMNLYDDKKSKENLVEVIYATLDGYIYFLDLEDGSKTRDPMWVGMNFKGAGTLDPRGYPLMYVGSGDSVGSTAPKMYVISLIDCTILYERSAADSFSVRGDGWSAFDSSPLIDVETDTLIWPGESGILYIIKLNTEYDKTAGTIKVNPKETVKCRYNTSRSNAKTYWVGYEPSAVIVDRYLYISENGGMFFCIDLNTMQLIWAQDTKDDSNSTPVFEWDPENKTGYIYTAPSLHWTADSDGEGSITIYKLNALNGEIIWEYKVDCHTVSGASGGVQSTPMLGKPGTDTEGYIFYTIARTTTDWTGTFVALDTKTGSVKWSNSMNNFTWSSPTPVYTESGKTYIVVCDCAGYVYLYEGTTGKKLSTVNLGYAVIEASPAIFENTIVIGTKGKKIYAIEIS